MNVYNLIMNWENVTLETKVEIVNTNWAVIYSGSCIELFVDGEHLDASVDSFKLVECDKILIKVH